jgi:hypothetical protein
MEIYCYTETLTLLLTQGTIITAVKNKTAGQKRAALSYEQL